MDDTLMEDQIALHLGPAPGLLGDIAALHGRYYAAEWGFPLTFEGKVACEMGEFFSRYDDTRDFVLSLKSSDHFLGSVIIDGSDPQHPVNEAHLRWFIIDRSLTGKGYGKKLLTEAIAFARRTAFELIYLTTFRGLESAATLYVEMGFSVVDEREGQSWGRTVTEQTLEVSL